MASFSSMVLIHATLVLLRFLDHRERFRPTGNVGHRLADAAPLLASAWRNQERSPQGNVRLSVSGLVQQAISTNYLRARIA